MAKYRIIEKHHSWTDCWGKPKEETSFKIQKRTWLIWDGFGPKSHSLWGLFDSL